MRHLQVSVIGLPEMELSVGCECYLSATRNWCSLGASFALNSGWLEIVSGMEKRLNMVDYDVVTLRCVVIPGLTGYLVLYVMYRWSMLLGNGSYDLFPGSLNIAMK